MIDDYFPSFKHNCLHVNFKTMKMIPCFFMHTDL